MNVQASAVAVYLQYQGSSGGPGWHPAHEAGRRIHDHLHEGQKGAWEQIQEMTMEAYLSMTPSFEYSVPDTPYRFVVMQRMIVAAANEAES